MAELEKRQISGNQHKPHLREQGDVTQLIVNSRPFLVLGGELHNSSSSNTDYMRPVWEQLVALNINTVLAPVSWELLEPEEGRFNFALVDDLIRSARRYNLRLILLWFGSWKNGMSSYIPSWMKKDYVRFPRAKLSDSKSIEVLSTFAAENWEADARAFAALMCHILAVDGHEHTVIMVQVENEVGLLGDSRDRSQMANEVFARPVPHELLTYLQENKQALVPEVRHRWGAGGFSSSGNWEEIFGSGAESDEIFMAWHYARYIDKIVAAGKSEYDIPMYVNAWLSDLQQQPGQWPSGGQRPGEWPSGGPLPHTHDIWLAGAPHLDLLAPDIYFGDFSEWCRQYTRRGNPLFIPEMRRDEEGPRNIFYAIGEHKAIGTSPFGVDSMANAESSSLRNSYEVLRQLAPLILEAQEHGTVIGFVLDEDHSATERDLGGYRLEIALDQGFGSKTEHGYGLIIANETDVFIGAGYGFRVKFLPQSSRPSSVGIAAVDEGAFCDGRWIAGRRLNGDETASGQWWRFPAPVERSGVIATLGPGTGISRCTVYRYE